MNSRKKEIAIAIITSIVGVWLLAWAIGAVARVFQ
jgi:hypothetical protein